MKSLPTDLKLYKRIKNKIYKKIPKHSAYRSGIVVKEYKIAFKKKHGNKSPYKGRKTRKHGLSRWFEEKWRNQRGEIGYKYKSDVYRPTRRITKRTPKTFNELTRKEIKRARVEKRRTKRVRKFKRGKRKRYGVEMNERLIEIIHPTTKGKKYTAIIIDMKSNDKYKISFGAIDYEQYKDSAPLQLYAKKNHGDKKRRRNYFNRFSGIPTKDKAVRKEFRKSDGRYNAKILSHIYLW